MSCFPLVPQPFCYIQMGFGAMGFAHTVNPSFGCFTQQKLQGKMDQGKMNQQKSGNIHLKKQFFDLVY